MILSETSVWMRAGQDGKPPYSHLMMCVEKPLLSKLSLARTIDSSTLAHTFARIFENSVSCGESGIHQYITLVDIATTKEFALAGFPNKMTPVKAWMLITLEEYDDLRIRRKQWAGRFENLHPFPEYSKMASRVGS